MSLGVIIGAAVVVLILVGWAWMLLRTFRRKV